MSETDNRNEETVWWQRLTRGAWLLIFAAGLALALTGVLSFNLFSRPQVSVTVGEPAGQNVIAPQTISYVSDVLTEQAREQARAGVSNVYTTRDLSIARAQISNARTIFNFIDAVRADSVADQETKLRYLAAIEELTIEPDIASLLLSLSPAEYAAARDDIVRIIGEAMRAEIRDEPAALKEARLAARTEYSFTLTEDQERVVTSLVPQFIVPNAFFNAEATTEQRDAAAAAVEPQRQEVLQGQYIVQVGERVRPEHLEMLQRLGLLQPEISWWRIGSIFMAAVLAATLVTLHWYRFHNPLHDAPRYLLLLGGLILLFALAGKLMVPGRGAFAYLYPAAALAMLVSVIFDVQLALFVSIILAGLVGFVAQESLELTLYMVFGSLFAALTLRDAQRINAFFRAGLVTAVAGMVVILAFRLTENAASVEILELLLFSLLNGFISASITLAGFFVIGGLFGMMTTLQLQDLSRLDHPLLKDLLRRAPGTYHHSIMVANLAEQGAERIDANSALVRVGAFYHDVGKMNRPPFFTENQEGINPHESLDPYSSARIIISHVPDGLEMARKHRLPDRIQDFIAEHHGDRLVFVFYKKAQEQAGDDEKVDESRFRYAGPRPRSREAGIVLLADSIEAASSAIRPNTAEAIEKLVNKIVDDHLKDGQLDNSGLTLGDVKELRESFIETLKGRFHVRVKYPGNEELMQGTETGHPITPQDAPVPTVPQPLSSSLLTQARQGEQG